MNQREILSRSKKKLTNNFTGMTKVSAAIMNKFQFNIENKTEVTKKLAIIPSYLAKLAIDMQTTSVTVVTAVDFGASSVTTEDIEAIVGGGIHNHDVAALVAAGYPVDVILDDATVDFDGKDFVMSSANPTKKIADFLDFIKTNPKMLKEMTIISDDPTAFATDMEVAKLDPFKRNAEALMDLNKFFDKYQEQNDRITINFDNELELSDVLLWTMNVPAGAKMQITLRF